MRYVKMPADLLIVLLWTITTFIFVITPILSGNPIRTILGIIMVLFIPGYVTMTALFPKKIDNVEIVALSFGLSIAIIPLIGMALNFTFGINLATILITLCTYTLLLIIISNYRRGNLEKEEKLSLSIHKIFDAIKPESKTDGFFTIMLIFMIMATIGSIYYVITAPKIGESFTEFYVLNSTSGQADNYPANLKINIPTTFLVGIGNHEYQTINYTVQIYLESELLKSENLTLYNNETLEKNMTIIPNKEGSDLSLKFLLFKNNTLSSPYRELHLWVNT